MQIFQNISEIILIIVIYCYRLAYITNNFINKKTN